MKIVSKQARDVRSGEKVVTEVKSLLTSDDGQTVFMSPPNKGLWRTPSSWVDVLVDEPDEPEYIEKEAKDLKLGDALSHWQDGEYIVSIQGIKGSVYWESNLGAVGYSYGKSVKIKPNAQKQ